MEQAERIIPNHLGLIVDGNRRWAKERGLTTYEGHKQGFEVLKQVAYYAQARRIPYLSAFIFSTENWQGELPDEDLSPRLSPRYEADDRRWLSDYLLRTTRPS